MKKIKKKIKTRERKKNSNRRYGNTTQHTTLTSRNGEICGANAPHISRAPTARVFSARANRDHDPCLISNKTVRREILSLPSTHRYMKTFARQLFPNIAVRGFEDFITPHHIAPFFLYNRTANQNSEPPVSLLDIPEKR